MKKLGNNLILIPIIFFLSLFILIIFEGIFAYKKVMFEFNTAFVLFGAIIYIGILYFLKNKVLYKLAEMKLIAPVLITIFAIINIFICNIMKVQPTWDMGYVLEIAQSKALGINTDSVYLYNFPHNLLLTKIYTLVFKIAATLTFTDFVTVATNFNSFFVTGTVILLYDTIKRLYSREYAIMILIISLFTTPLYFYSSLYYTDTPSMFFIMLILWTVLRIKQNKGGFLLNLLFGLACFMAIEIKIITAIFIISGIIFIVLKGSCMKTIKIFGIGILTFMLLISSFRILNKDIYYSDKSDTLKYPPTHWIMMGLSGRGEFNPDDYAYTSQFESYKEKNEAAIKKINKKISDYSGADFINLIRAKLNYAWHDGTYYFPEKLRREPVYKNPIHDYVLTAGNKNYLYKYFPQSMHFGMLILMIFAGLGCIRKRFSFETIMITTILGLALFLLMWENRSRYIVAMLPIMMMLQISGIRVLDNIISYFKQIINRKKSLL